MRTTSSNGCTRSSSGDSSMPQGQRGRYALRLQPLLQTREHARATHGWPFSCSVAGSAFRNAVGTVHGSALHLAKLFLREHASARSDGSRGRKTRHQPSNAVHDGEFVACIAARAVHEGEFLTKNPVARARSTIGGDRTAPGRRRVLPHPPQFTWYNAGIAARRPDERGRTG